MSMPSPPGRNYDVTVPAKTRRYSSVTLKLICKKSSFPNSITLAVPTS